MYQKPKPQSYKLQFLRHRVRQTEFSVILGHFCPFTPLLTPEIKIWQNLKNTGDIILLQMCIINKDPMMYVS